MRRRGRIVWSVDWPVLLILWPLLIVEALITGGYLALVWTVRFSVWLLKWLFKPPSFTGLKDEESTWP